LSRLIPLSALFLLAAAGLQGALKVERIALHQYEDGPVLAQNYEVLPGETVYFSCRFSGFQANLKDEERKVSLTWDAKVVDAEGLLLEKPFSGSIEENLLTEDKTWLPKFLLSFSVPGFAASGTYRVEVHLRDLNASADLNAALEFKVRGHAVEPSETLTARNFRFLQSEEDSAGMTSPIFHPGETLWARFDITGYKRGEGNRFAVEYGLAVEDGSHRQLFSQPAAAEDSGSPFYPKRYVPGVLSLSLDKNVGKGTYTLVVILRDQVGQQLHEERQAFQVE
jgi:hypothetical protein